MRDWLTARPIAHRGLHDAGGAIENTASAFRAAIAGGYGIECDIQISADGEAMVHHDDALGRLTDAAGPLVAMPAAELKRIAFKATADRMLTLGELCDLVAGRAALVIEIKSRFDGGSPAGGARRRRACGLPGAGRADVVRSRADRSRASASPIIRRGLIGMRREPDAPAAQSRRCASPVRRWRRGRNSWPTVSRTSPPPRR